MQPVPPPPDASDLPERPTKSRGELLKNSDVPHYQKLPFILGGYRPVPKGACGLLRTVFSLHNETGNMWTHLVGFGYVLGVGAQLISELAMDEPGAIEADEVWLLALVVATAFCMLASFLYHLFNCTEQRVCECMYRMDLTGIVALIIMSYLTGIALGYRCFPGLRVFYLCFATLVAAALALPLMFRRHLVSNMARHLIFCCLFGIVPAAHWVLIASGKDVRKVLPYLLCMAACYGIGAWIFVERWPECRWPGRFDIVGHSHQLWHMFVFAAAVSWVRGGMAMLKRFGGLECDGP